MEDLLADADPTALPGPLGMILPHVFPLLLGKLSAVPEDRLKLLLTNVADKFYDLAGQPPAAAELPALDAAITVGAELPAAEPMDHATAAALADLVLADAQLRGDTPTEQASI